MVCHAGEKGYTIMAKKLVTIRDGVPSIKREIVRQARVFPVSETSRGKYNTGETLVDKYEMTMFAARDIVNCAYDGGDHSEYGLVHGSVDRREIDGGLYQYDYLLIEVSISDGIYEPILLFGGAHSMLRILPRIFVY
jgi:hypothetical protein